MAKKKKAWSGRFDEQGDSFLEGVTALLPLSLPPRRAFGAAAILWASPCGMIFCFPSIRTCAMLPSMSCR